MTSVEVELVIIILLKVFFPLYLLIDDQPDMCYNAKWITKNFDNFPLTQRRKHVF